MGRSVDYLSYAMFKTFIDYDGDFDVEDGTIDYGIAQENWQWFKEGLIERIQSKLPSLDVPSPTRWDGDETIILLENKLCEIGLSEYCGLVSVSIRVNESKDYWQYRNIAERWIKQNWPTIEKVISDNYTKLNKVGSFSNGEGVYELAK